MPNRHPWRDFEVLVKKESAEALKKAMMSRAKPNPDVPDFRLWGLGIKIKAPLWKNMEKNSEVEAAMRRIRPKKPNY